MVARFGVCQLRTLKRLGRSRSRIRAHPSRLAVGAVFVAGELVALLRGGEVGEGVLLLERDLVHDLKWLPHRLIVQRFRRRLVCYLVALECCQSLSVYVPVVYVL